MPQEERSRNPFYALVVVSGAAFAITACAYGVFTYQAIRGVIDPDETTTGFWGLINLHGGAVLGVEIAVLAVATFAAIATENFWQRRSD